MSSRGFVFAAALAVLAACAKSNGPADIPGPVREDLLPPCTVRDLSDGIRTGAPGTSVIGADYGETRAHLEMNGDQTYASTVWKAGDTFYAYGYSSEQGSWYQADYTTSGSGVYAEFSSRYSLPVDPPVYAVYPKITKLGSVGSTRVLGISLPAEQTAVAGNIADGLAVAYASAPDLSGPLHFQSQVSLVRFRLAGALVPSVTRIVLKGAGSLAGDAMIALEADGTGTLTQDWSFNGDVHASSVTLTGPFVAGQDYYIAVYPGTQSGFQMVFSDGEGHSTTKLGPQFTFPRARISDFGTIDLGGAFTDDSVDTTPVRYMAATAPVPKPVTIAVIPDGFTASEMPSYEMLARSAIDALMATEPFNSYREYFNVWILKAASRESGASVTDGNGNVTTYVDCYFGSKWGAESYSDMTANVTDVFSFVTDNCPDIVNGYHTIDEVPILMIINDARYGGICHAYSNGAGYCQAPYSYNGGAMAWAYPANEPAGATAQPQDMRAVTNAEREEMGNSVGDWRNTVVHEFGGHCFSRLADEYWYDSYKSAVPAMSSHSWDVPYGLNISATYDNPGWKEAMLGNDLTVLPSLVERDSRYGRIGVFQGGDVSMFNRWRNEKTSCMIDNRFYFSAWQRVVIVQRIMTLSGDTFNFESFWAKDNPTDPLRDSRSGAVYGEHPLPVRTVPMLPPPDLHP